VRSELFFGSDLLERPSGSFSAGNGRKYKLSCIVLFHSLSDAKLRVRSRHRQAELVEPRCGVWVDPSLGCPQDAGMMYTKVSGYYFGAFLFFSSGCVAGPDFWSPEAVPGPDL
jgi:hypothetical protein